MKNIKKVVAVAMTAMMALTAVGCNMIQKTPEAINKSVVAVVGSEKITYGDLDKELEYLKEQLKEQYGESYESNEKAMSTLKEKKKTVLDAMVLEKVYLAKAKELKLVPEEEELNKEVNTQFDNMKASFGDEEKFKTALQESKLTEDSLKEAIKNSVIAQKVEEYIVKDVKVEDSDIEAYYNENKDSKYTTGPGANLSHILVKDEETAKSIKSKLDNKGDFAALAKEYGTDGTKDTGGSLGFYPYDTEKLDKDFMNAAKTLKEGEVSGPVKTQFGYHIIKATGLKTESVVKSLDEVKSEIKTYLTQTKQGEAYSTTIEQWKKDLKVEIKEKNLEQ